MYLSCWVEGQMKGPGSWWSGASSQLGSALLPISLIRPPAACSACFCLVGPFQRTPPEHDNTEHQVNSLCSHFPSRNVSIPFLTSFLGNTSPCHIETIAHTWTAHENWPKWNREAQTNSHVGAGLTFVGTYLPQPLKPTSHLLSSMTCSCSCLPQQDIKSPMCCRFNN